jgi:hypothetical protein
MSVHGGCNRFNFSEYWQCYDAIGNNYTQEFIGCFAKGGVIIFPNGSQVALPGQEGGVFSNVGPLDTDLGLLLLQVCDSVIALLTSKILFIQFFSRALSYLLAYLLQPRVVAEILAGIILGMFGSIPQNGITESEGPSCLGNIPGFTSHIFPPGRNSYLKLVGDIGLVLFLFLGALVLLFVHSHLPVGLHLDLEPIRKSIFKTVLTSITGMVVPFGTSISLFILMRLTLRNRRSSSAILVYLFSTSWPHSILQLYAVHLCSDVHYSVSCVGSHPGRIASNQQANRYQCVSSCSILTP